MDSLESFPDNAHVSSAEPGLALQYIRVLADGLREEGVDVDGVLRRYGLDPTALDAADQMIPFALFEPLAAEVVTLVGEPSLGISLGARLTPSTHGSLGLAAVSSATARELLAVIARFLATRITVLSSSILVEGPRVVLVLEELLSMGTVRELVLEAVLLSIKNTLSDASMGRCPIVEISFPFARPDYVELAEETFGCPVRYGAGRTCLEIPAAMVDEPLKMADPRAVELAASLCEREIDKLGASRSFEIRTRRSMLQHRQGFPSMVQVARRLHVTPRTLARKLGAEGTSYRAILDDLRQRMATDLIKSGSKIDEVAYLLGYTDTSNFRRAFRRWTGVAPSAFR